MTVSRCRSRRSRGVTRNSFPCSAVTSIHFLGYGYLQMNSTREIRPKITERIPLTIPISSPRLSAISLKQFFPVSIRGGNMAGKGDVINAIAEQAGISKKEASAAFDAFVGYISDSCQRGERCAIPGLGSFNVSQRKAREGRNPRTNEKITIPASKNVRFKAGKDLREMVNSPRRAGKTGRK